MILIIIVNNNPRQSVGIIVMSWHSKCKVDA